MDQACHDPLCAWVTPPAMFPGQWAYVGSDFKGRLSAARPLDIGVVLDEEKTESGSLAPRISTDAHNPLPVM